MMKNTAEIQMGCSPSTHFKHPLISFTVLLLILSLLPISPTLFTLLILALSSVILLTSLRKKKASEEISIPSEEEVLLPACCSPKKPPEMEVFLPHQLKSEAPIAINPEMDETHPTTVESPDLSSDCEGADLPSSTSNDSEADWSFQCKGSQVPPPCSDGSISDDDSLIEIALPGSQYVGSNEPEELFWPYSSEFLPKRLFHQDELTELIPEIDEMNEMTDVNEEENLIEIDISAGSIKYPRLKIKA